jgi:hypothetical protein
MFAQLHRIRRGFRVLAPFAALILLAPSPAARASGGLNVDFGLTHGAPSSTYAAASGQTGS